MFPVFYPSPHINIPMYLVMMSLAFSVAIVYFYKRAIRLNLPPKISTEISIVVMFGAFIGARIFHIIFEYPHHYWDDPIEVFKVYKGGFVFYGGLFGGLLASYLYVKKLKQNYLNWLDCAAPVMSLGYIIGRVACVIGGCCFGKQCDLPWAIKFPPGVEAPANVPLHPTQFYSMALEAIVWCVILMTEKRKKLKPGSLFFLWILLHSIARLIVEQFRGDFRGDTLFGFSISSVISFGLIGISAFLLSRAPSSQK